MKRFFAITAALAGVIALACAVLRRNGALQQPGRSGVELEVRTPSSVTVAGRATPLFLLELWSKLSESLCTFATAAALLWLNKKHG